jgi:hypothetical protein
VTTTQPSTISLRSTKSTISATGHGALTLACSGATSCAGTFTLQVAAKHADTTALAHGRYSLAKGTTKHITFTLTSTARSMLRAHHRHLSTTLRLTPSVPKPITHALTLTQAGSRG